MHRRCNRRRCPVRYAGAPGQNRRAPLRRRPVPPGSRAGDCRRRARNPPPGDPGYRPPGACARCASRRATGSRRHPGRAGRATARTSWTCQRHWPR
nr:hypothetical 10.8K protein - Pseudomonas aeruginosa [Pseudomonas aeruginosa]